MPAAAGERALLWAVLLCAALVSLVSILLGAWLLFRRRDLLGRGRTAVLPRVVVAGLLIGISVLSVLPDALDALVAAGWRTEAVLLLFIGSLLAQFTLEHIILGHSHAPPSTPLMSTVAPGVPAAGKGLDRAPEGAVATTATSATMDSIVCEPCDPATPERAEPPAAAEPPPRAASWAAGWARWVNAGPEQCECCDEDGVPLPAGVRGELPPGSPVREGDGAQLLGPRRALCAEGLAGLRLLAWFVHAMFDGVVLGACPSLGALPPLAAAIFACALQDTAAFCVIISARNVGRIAELVSIVLFSLALPVGAGATAFASAAHDDEWELIAASRVVIAALFVYMAAEMAPPHSHSRARNLKYALAFVLGAATASLAEFIEGATTGR